MTALAKAFEQVLAAFDRLEIPFLVGGSLASSTHGLPRYTNDIDLLADISPERVEEFCEGLGPDFYVDPTEARRSAEAGRAFNVIHRGGAYKFDIFPVNNEPFARSEIQRRRYAHSPVAGLEHIEFPVASAEDTILSKLVWYRKGGETSDRQWNDILGVLKVQAALLDSGYLSRWAAELGVASLLERARRSLQ